ncbi:MAG: TRAP transporter substrate-binding protein DctP [Verrucomicrobia bacterium]|nr:TRAP transporter substrate-binding protein DctP [Verrucomicrobiota bacterium]
MTTFLRLWAALGLLILPVAAAPLVIRMGTILPRDIGPDLVLTRLAQDWKTATNGTVQLRRAPAGQSDGEAGIVKKLRSGNYQAGLLSVTGLVEIEPDVAALQFMPLVFRNWDEVDYVRDHIRGELEARLAAKGFVVLLWADGGWVRFFSRSAGFTPDDFRRMRVFTWAGDTRQLTLMHQMRFQPVALETDNIHQAFASGMIDAAPLPPSFALGGQIHTVAGHVLAVNWCPIVGAVVVRRDAWEAIPAATRAKLVPLCEAAGAAIRAEGRRFDEQAVQTLAHGPRTVVHTPTAEQQAAWEALSTEVNPLVRGTLVPGPIYDEVQRLLAEHRAQAGTH